MSKEDAFFSSPAKEADLIPPLKTRLRQVQRSNRKLQNAIRKEEALQQRFNQAESKKHELSVRLKQLKSENLTYPAKQ